MASKLLHPGTVTGCTTENVERVLRGLGGYGASGNGLEVLVECGDRVTTGTPILRVHHSNPVILSFLFLSLSNLLFDDI